MVLIKATLATFGKPDVQGDVMLPPIDVSHFDGEVTYNFGAAIVGELVAFGHFPDKLVAWINVNERLVETHVPVIGFSVPSDNERDGVWRQPSLWGVAMTPKESAILPANFEMEVVVSQQEEDKHVPNKL